MEELGLYPIRETPTVVPPAGGRSKKKDAGRGRGRGKGPTSSSRVRVGAEEEEDVEETGKRTVWSVAENVALMKAWVVVVKDPYIGVNQYIDKMWLRISQGYLRFKPPVEASRSRAMPEIVGAVEA